MLKSAKVVKGSLKQDQLSELPLLEPLSQSTAEEFSGLCKLLPPIRESCLTYDEVSDINSTMRICFGESYMKTLLLHEYSCAVFFQNELYGSVDSHHANSSLVYVGTGHRSSGGTTCSRPGFVRKYVKVVVLLNVPSTQPTQLLPAETGPVSPNCHNPNCVAVYLAAVNWLDVHPYKDWFGAPVEVWQKPIRHPQPDTFVPITNILCRCAYVTKKVRFNRVMEEEITAVIPINHFTGLL